ncbi:MAG: YgeY family selenium metabolism-linked hydrolase, partial [Longimicrobiaceae bacterium]
MGRDLSFERAIGFAADLIRIPSLSGEEGAVAERIAVELRALGFDEVRFDHAGNVIGRVAGTGASLPLMLSSHMDVVEAGDPGSWEHDP